MTLAFLAESCQDDQIYTAGRWGQTTLWRNWWSPVAFISYEGVSSETGDQLRPFCNSIRIFSIWWLTECCQLFSVLSQLSSTRVKNLFSTHWNPSPGTSRLKWASSHSVLLVVESLKVVNCFRPSLFPATIQSCGLQLIHGLHYNYYAVSYAVWFKSFSDTKIFSRASQTLQKVWRAYRVLCIVMMIPKLGDCRSEVMVDKYSPWVFIWTRTSCSHLWALSRMRKNLNARLLDFR
jgi:hypothetical protein